MFLNAFLFIIIYIAGETNSKNISIPPCAEWRSGGKVIIGSSTGISGKTNDRLKSPTAIIVDDQNSALYILDSGNSRLMKYKDRSSVGTRVVIKNDPGKGVLRRPQDIAIDQKGRIYISEAGANRVLRWTLDPPKSEVLLKVTSPGRMYLDDDNDNLYIVRKTGAACRVIRYDLKSSKEESLFHIFSNSTVPAGIYVDGKGTVFIAETGRHRIVRWSPKRRKIEIVAGTGEPGPYSWYLNHPSSVILNEAGMMYVADTFNDRISYWIQNGSSSSCFLDCSVSPPLVSRPYAITFDSKMNFLVVEKQYNRVQQFDISFDFECIKRICKPPRLSIRPHPRTHDRSDSMTIFIDAKLDCGIWLETIMECTAVVCFPGDLACNQTADLNTVLTSFQVPKSHNLRIPPFGLPVGMYNFSCRITMTITGYNSTINTTLQIVRYPRAVTLLSLGVSKILLGYNEQYTFSPKISKNDMMFENMKFVYYCRKYPQFNYTTINGIRQNIDQDGHNPTSSTCFNLKAKPKSFIYDDNNIRSSMTIMSQSLAISQTYEFYVEMYDNTKIIERSDVVLIEIRSEDSSPIQIASVFDTLTLDNDYQLFNPTTQLFLRSFYDDSYADASIQWRVYFGVRNASSIIEWEEYLNIRRYSNQWFYGVNLPMFTVIPTFFSMYRNVSYWQLAVTYTVEKKTAFGAVQLKMNHPPAKGNCSASPTIGFTNGLFTIICKGWTDFDGIKDYFLHVISSSSSPPIMSIAHSIDPVFRVHLPMGDPNDYFYLRLMVYVRDELGATTKSDVMRVQIRRSSQFMQQIAGSTDNIPIIGDRNQVITSYSSILNRLALDDQATLINSSQVKLSDLMASTFDSPRSSTERKSDLSAAMTFMRNLNRRAIIREYFLNFYEEIPTPTSIESMIILSSTINQLINTRSEWTQKTLSTAANICYRLSDALYTFSPTVTIEDITLVANSLAQCISNVFTGMNGPLQQRGFIFDHNLDKNYFYSNEIGSEIVEYDPSDTNIPFCDSSGLKRNQACRELVVDRDNSSREVKHKNYELYIQKRLAGELRLKIQETTLFVSKSIQRHLNILQDVFIKFPVLRMNIEQIQKKNLEDKLINLKTLNATIYLPKSLSFVSSDQLSIGTTLLPLAPEGGDANVAYSAALTLSIFDSNNQEISINASDESPIEMIIPRDVNLPIPAFMPQNITDVIAPKRGSAKYNRQYFTYYINITQINPNLTVSVHLDLQPTVNGTSYLIISAFDRIPSYNSTNNITDHWAMLCARNPTDEMDYYRYYIDNYKTAGFESLYLGIRELKEKEECNDDALPGVTDEPYAFSSDFSVRLYASGCYYLDRRGYWKSDGMKVGNKTNFEYTHCYSTHT